MTISPHYIYQYRPDVRPRDLETLVSSQVWSAKRSSLNDPFEFAALRPLGYVAELASHFDNVGITCFCRSLTNPLLWSHYADAHRGFVVAYDKTHPHFGGEALKKGFLHDVRYEDAVPDIERLSANDFWLSTVTTKHTCWSYEQEVRLVAKQGDRLIEVPVDMIKAVVFGTQMTAERVAVCTEAITRSPLNVKFFRMHNLNRGYGVVPQPLSLGDDSLST